MHVYYIFAFCSLKSITNYNSFYSFTNLHIFLRRTKLSLPYMVFELVIQQLIITH